MKRKNINEFDLRENTINRRINICYTSTIPINNLNKNSVNYFQK